MAKRRAKSPLRVVCKPSAIPGRKLCRWQCVGDVAAAEFSHRGEPSETAILHKSTKRNGKWQLSFFQSGEPYSDVQDSSCTVLLRELPPSLWRLRKVETR